MIRRLIVSAAILGALLSGCANGGQAASDQASVVVLNAYVRATDEPMTGAFMIIQNASDEAVSLVSATADISGMVEIHEVVNGMMQKKEGGIAIPAGAEAELKPGGDHIMMMGLSGPVDVGSEVALSLTFSDGTVIDVLAPVKEVNAEQEHYHSS